jgi:hypothetical protein
LRIGNLLYTRAYQLKSQPLHQVIAMTTLFWHMRSLKKYESTKLFQFLIVGKMVIELLPLLYIR